MVYQKNWLGYSTDIDLHFEKSSQVGKAWKLLTFFLKTLVQYDVFHFNCGSSIIPNWRYASFLGLSDLPILRMLGKRIVVTYQGSDARQKDFCADKFVISPYGGQYGLELDHKDKEDMSDMLKRKRIEKFGRYAHRIFALNPDLLHVLPPRTEFLPYCNVDLDQWQPIKKAEGRNLVIMHSPTNRGVKGTKYIIEAVERLKAKYKDIELILVEGVPHAKVQEVYRKADLAIDQLLLGWYGGFAVEMMALGKPVVCYIREEDLNFIPEQMRNNLPIINANPDTIYNVLAGLVEERDKLHSIGEQSRAYVEMWHDPMKIAKRTKEVYESISSR
jgi:glycosyltransferase involved in cell wall biosynthesis